MPELPDVTLYQRALQARIVGQPLKRARVVSPSLLRTFDPPVSAVEGKKVRAIRRLGKRIAWELDGEFFLVFHLMIAGRFRWNEQPDAKIPKKLGHGAFEFPNGTVLLTEASSKKRASLHVVQGEPALSEHNPGGLEVLESGLAEFGARLTAGNHTVKRALTDPRTFSGIGNAYSDEILFRAGMSPTQRTQSLSDESIATLYDATQSVLGEWVERLLDQFGDRFPGPGEVTAFRPGFAVHGRYGEPCLVCHGAIQRIRYVGNETNYCPRCQTGGRLLSDRSLARLLKKDWPKTIEELENLRPAKP